MRGKFFGEQDTKPKSKVSIKCPRRVYTKFTLKPTYATIISYKSMCTSAVERICSIIAYSTIFTRIGLTIINICKCNSYWFKWCTLFLLHHEYFLCCAHRFLNSNDINLMRSIQTHFFRSRGQEILLDKRTCKKRLHQYNFHHCYMDYLYNRLCLQIIRYSCFVIL